jgi:hypothetical protein
VGKSRDARGAVAESFAASRVRTAFLHGPLFPRGSTTASYSTICLARPVCEARAATAVVTRFDAPPRMIVRYRHLLASTLDSIP